VLLWRSHRPLLLTPEAMLFTMAAATSLGFLMRGSNTNDTPPFVVMRGVRSAVGCASAICTSKCQASAIVEPGVLALLQLTLTARLMQAHLFFHLGWRHVEKQHGRWGLGEVPRDYAPNNNLYVSIFQLSMPGTHKVSLSPTQRPVARVPASR